MSTSLDRVLLLPELVELVVLGLHDHSTSDAGRQVKLAHCTQVSQSWRLAFIPFYWRDVYDDPDSRFGITFKRLWPIPLGPERTLTAEQILESQQVRVFVYQFLRFVRHLSIVYPWTLDLFLNYEHGDNASDNHLRSTELLSLVIGHYWWHSTNMDRVPPPPPIPITTTPSRTTINSIADYYFQEDEEEEVPSQMEQDLVSSSQALPRTHQQQQWRVPGNALEDRGSNSAYFYPEQLSVSHAHWRLMLRSVSRAHWRLIIRSPRLKSLVFGWSNREHIWSLALKHTSTSTSASTSSSSSSASTTTPPTTLTAAPGARFFAQVLQRLENLSHLQRLQLSFGEEEVILEVMAQQQSLGHCQNLRSFTANRGFSIPCPTGRLLIDYKNLCSRFYNPCIQTLDLLFRPTTRQFRFFLETLPNLSSLTLSVIDDNHYTTQEGQESELEAVQPVLIHNALKSLRIDGHASGFGKSRVRLERLETFTACSLGPEIMDLERLLRWFMPNCKTIKVAVRCRRWRERTPILSFPSTIPAAASALFLEESTSTATASDAIDQGQAKQGRRTVPLAVQEIEYDYKLWPPTREVQESLVHMPFLTKIEFQHQIDGAVVETLSKSCPKLQRFRVSGGVRRFSSRGVSKLLGACPDLLTVSGPGLALRAIDVIQYQPWVCLGLKELECRIISVPRLTDQERDQVLKLDRDLKTPESLGEELVQERRCWDPILWQTGDEGMKQARSRIQMLRHNRGLLRLRSRSREVQEQVFSGLARLQNLEILNLGEATKQDKAVRDRPWTLEWSFESGVQRLESLTKLEVLKVNLHEHRIRENQEVVWMKNTWPKLEVGPF